MLEVARVRSVLSCYCLSNTFIFCLKERQLKEEKKRKKERENVKNSASDTNSRKLRSSKEQSSDDGDLSVPSHVSRRPLPGVNGSDMHPTSSSHLPLGKLGQYDSPRPNRRFVKGVSQSMQSPPSESDEEENGHKVRTTSSLTNAHWLREAHTHGARGEALPSSQSTATTKSGLTPFGHQSAELGRRVLAPLTPLEPLAELREPF